MKKVIRLTESDLTRIVRRVIVEQAKTNQSSSTTTSSTDKNYCSNIEQKMEFDHTRAHQIDMEDKYRNFKIRTYPNHSESKFGSLHAINKTKRGDFSVLIYCSASGTSGHVETSDYHKAHLKQGDLINEFNLVCRRLNTCYPNGNQQV